MIERLNTTIVAYEPQFDRSAYQNLEDKDKTALNAYTKRQLETHLGERFNVLLSTTRYEIKNGQIFAQNTEEPFVDTLTRGRNYRRAYGNPSDFEREDAEVGGFSKMESTLTSEAANAGDMMLSVSPPGGESSIYKHNFYDIFTLRQESGQKFIEARRYSSGLTLEETTNSLKEKGFIAEDQNPTAEGYLANPILIKPEFFETAQDLHKFLHKEHEYTFTEDFEEAKAMITSLIVSYVNSLSENPFNIYDQNSKLNAALNGMDVAMEYVQKNKGKNIDSRIPQIFNDKDYIYALSRAPVRQAMTGCGFSGGLTTQAKELMDSPFSLNDSIKRTTEKQMLCCTCPFCNKQVEAEIGGGKITCPNCRKSASWN